MNNKLGNKNLRHLTELISGFLVLPDINLNSSVGSVGKDQGAIGALMASSLGRITLGSLGFGRDLAEVADYRLPPVQKDSSGKLVQVKMVMAFM